MIYKKLDWYKCNTLSKQTAKGQPTATDFLWATDNDGNIWIKSNETKQMFTRDDYQAMISHVSESPDAVPLGSRRDGLVPENSIGALMQQRKGSSSIRGWCSHLAAIAVQNGQLEFIDTGRGPGKGIYLYIKR